ncbi:MAG TPA: HAD family hydrolase [Chloroflexota bacterium]|nr:HAD family hydrolase [Chloroflexota bacterium]
MPEPPTTPLDPPGPVWRARRAAVFLDRDGTLNQAEVVDGIPRPPADAAQLTWLPGVPAALARLKRAGLWLVVITNQPDVKRGRVSRASVEAINARVLRELPVDAIETCFHDDADQCACRKPQPGMLLDAARRLDLDLAASFLVGDRWRDIGAGRAAGCTTIWLRHPWREATWVPPDYEATDMTDAAAFILRRLTADGAPHPWGGEPA